MIVSEIPQQLNIFLIIVIAHLITGKPVKQMTVFSQIHTVDLIAVDQPLHICRSCHPHVPAEQLIAGIAFHLLLHLRRQNPFLCDLGPLLQIPVFILRKLTRFAKDQR